jgi:prefoldin alpha subunit
MTKEEDLQRRVVEFQVLEANFKIFQERLEVLNDKIEEFQKTRIAIEELKETKQTKAMIPLGSGVFVYGTVDNANDVIIGVGGGIALKGKREDAIKIIDEKTKELETELNSTANQTSVIALRLDKIQEEIEKLQK